MFTCILICIFIAQYFIVGKPPWDGLAVSPKEQGITLLNLFISYIYTPAYFVKIQGMTTFWAYKSMCLCF